MAKKVDPLDLEVQHVLKTMSLLEPGTDAYGLAATQLKTLKEAKSLLTSKSINPDVLLGVVGSFAQILLIMGHERLHVFATKALNYVTKGR